MGKCINHPERETRYLCMKHQFYLCEQCLQCKDPKIYCKHRSACPIWFMSKQKAEGHRKGRHRPADVGAAMVQGR
ncbi:MAG TPA: hypothetical protein VLT88_01915 [Desulfosarcina sp.]|nr:hypothetical protein [Desulfosarcina sp.]